MLTLGTAPGGSEELPTRTRLRTVRVAGDDVGQEVLRETTSLLWRGAA